MHNFIAKFRNILEICKKCAGNQVHEKGNVPRRGVVPTFSDLEVVALSITAEAFSVDSENYQFNRLNKECPGGIPNLITRRQFNQRRKLTSQQMKLPTNGPLPIFFIADTFNRVVFCSQGYTIGLGEQLQRVIKSL